MQDKKKMSKKEKATKIILSIIIWIIFIQLGTLASRLSRVLPGRPYKEAKIYMSAAMVFNAYYTFPMQYVFGVDSTIAKPAIIIREKLYQKGKSLLPKDDAEAELWWARIQGMDYMWLLKDVYSSYGYKGKTYKKYPPEYMLKKYDELYPHVISLATLPVKDAGWENEGDRLGVVNKFADLYIDGKELMYACKYKGCNFYLDSKNDPYIADKKEMQKLKNIFNAHVGLINRFPQGEYARLNPEYPYYQETVINSVSNVLLGADLLNAEFSCESSYVSYFYKSSDEIWRQYSNPKISKTDVGNSYAPIMARPLFMEVADYINLKCKNKNGKIVRKEK